MNSNLFRSVKYMVSIELYHDIYTYQITNFSAKMMVNGYLKNIISNRVSEIYRKTEQDLYGKTNEK